MKNQVEQKIVYHDLKAENNIDPDMVDQIDKDVRRTFFPAYHKSKESTDEKEIEALIQENEEMRQKTKRILIAYAAVDKTIAYIQGFNSIVGALVYCFHMAEVQSKKIEPCLNLKIKLSFDEEEVFYTFYGLMFFLGWRTKFLSGMDEIASMCENFGILMKKEDPKLYKKFFSNNVNIR